MCMEHYNLLTTDGFISMSKACCKTSSIVDTNITCSSSYRRTNKISLHTCMDNMMLIYTFTLLGISLKSFSFFFGIITWCIPARWAANTFSLMPPTWRKIIIDLFIDIKNHKDFTMTSTQMTTRHATTPLTTQRFWTLTLFPVSTAILNWSISLDVYSYITYW